MPATAAISAHELSKSYGDITAAARVTFEVAEGEIFAYLGRNGSGKTTTVRMLTTLTRPTAGTATVAGIDIARPRELRRRIGVTLQEAALDPTMTAIEHLRLVGGLWGMSRAEALRRAHASLEAFGLVEHADRKIASFSGGMQRRLDIATALLGEPRVLFLDEPTIGLDPQSRRALWTDMRRLRDGGVTVFLTTQYLEEADELADRIAIVDRGAIIAEGTSASLKAEQGRTTIAVEHSGTLDQLRAALDGVGRAAAVEASGSSRAEIKLAPAADPGEILAVLDRLRQRGPEIRHLSVRETSLEDVFLNLPEPRSSLVASTQRLGARHERACQADRPGLRPAGPGSGARSRPLLRAPDAARAAHDRRVHCTVRSHRKRRGLHRGKLRRVPDPGRGRAGRPSRRGATSSSLAADLRSGYLERLRLLPIGLASLLAGRVLFEAARLLPGALVVVALGFAFGAQASNGVLGIAVVVALVALVGVAYSGIFYVVAVRTQDPQTPFTLQPLGLPLAFLSSALVPLAVMPAWGESLARLNPVTVVVNGAREAMLGNLVSQELLSALGVLMVWITLGELLAWRALVSHVRGS